ncbi:MAG: periplasmic heavy metal sensor [Planctomycetaceae bacterium]|jgi:Spy/CpxP family protein refolding chaperone|nr:periplasmic heavy metal sensor [Planctomycetaceae bacterium]
MWKKSIPYLIVGSVALNVAFVAMWVAHAAPVHRGEGQADLQAGQEAVWCPLHRELKVTEEQWAQIEPRLQEFQASVAEACQQADTIRADVIGLIAADEPDVDAIYARQDELLATKRQIQRLVVDHLLAEKEVLTPEQQQRLFTMLRDRTGCTMDPPMSGSARGGLGRTLQDRGED